MQQAKPEIAIIGAGPAGLSCASELVRSGFAPVLYEKSRGFGGRVATRRRGGLYVDHGAQFLRASSDAAQRLIEAARADGHVSPWPSGAEAFGEDAWIGTPGMKDLLAPLADGIEVEYSSLVSDLHKENGKWRVVLDNADSAIFDIVVIAIPAPQVLRFMDEGETALRSELEHVRFSSCCALMVSFEVRPDWPDVISNPGAPFDLLLRDGSKPGRPADMECWLAHANDAWSQAHSSASLEEIGRLLLNELEAVMGALPSVTATAGHRWRFARAETPLGKPFAESSDGKVLVGGDWALGTEIEDALESGYQMARAIIGSRNYGPLAGV
jgi:predicted NAD/FAD-dependent oxidoreductase